MKQTYTLELDSMEFHSFHGCLDTEKVAGNLFVVDFRGTLPCTQALSQDTLEGTVNYADIYNIVKEQMSIPSNLLEHLASRIVEAIDRAFPQFIDFSVRVSKSCPPVDGVCKWSRVTFSK